MSDRIDVVVIGAGPAGLAVSRELVRAGVVHILLEKDRVGYCHITLAWYGRTV